MLTILEAYVKATNYHIDALHNKLDMPPGGEDKNTRGTNRETVTDPTPDHLFFVTTAFGVSPCYLSSVTPSIIT